MSSQIWRGAAAIVGLTITLVLSGCNTAVYVRDGVTDGDRFSLPPHVYADDSPVLQSWVAYSLARSICQLEMGGDNPARNSSFECELSARDSLVSRWRELGTADAADNSDVAYLNTLVAADNAGLLREYVWQELRRNSWATPDSLKLSEYREWAGEALGRGHRAQTQIIGSWGYIAGTR
ncbi:MAG: hypothetical protein AAF270_13790 [Pseudomonadota bacterium]